MSPVDMRIAIAEYFGFEDINLGTWKGLRRQEDGSLGDEEYESVPDYLSDHNAMYAARQTLTSDELRGYGMELNAILVESMRAKGCRKQADFDANPKWVFHASCEQQAEAFCRVKGILTEEDAQ